MPYCPKCRSEYDEGIKTCYDCRCDLVDELPPEQESAENEMHFVREALLMTVADEMEYRIVESKLAQYDIPVSKKYREAGAVTQIYMGRTFGLDLYVPEAALRQAKEIIAEDVEGGQNESAYGEQVDAYQDTAHGGTWARRIVLAFIVMVLGVLGFLAVMYLISFFSLL